MSWESSKGCAQCRTRRHRLPDHLSREPSLLRTKVHRVRGVMIRKGLDPPGPLALLRSSVGTPLGGTGLWRLGSVVGQGTPPGSNALSARRGPVRSAQLHGGDVAAGEEFLLRSSESCVEHVRFMSSERYTSRAREQSVYPLSLTIAARRHRYTSR